MTGFFYNLGRKLRPVLRKARWIWTASTAAEAEAVEAEHAAGIEMCRAVLKLRRVCEDSPQTELLNATGSALAGRVKDKRRCFTFICLHGDNPEAFCLPGGFIFMSRPMLDLCGENAGEIAFVLSHEMAHVLEGHALQRVVGETVLRAITKAGSIKFAGAGLLNKLGLELMSKAYSREHELEADCMGLRLMRAAGYDGQSTITFFEKIIHLERRGIAGKYFSTHPEVSERIALMEQLLYQDSSSDTRKHGERPNRKITPRKPQ